MSYIWLIYSAYFLVTAYVSLKLKRVIFQAYLTPLNKIQGPFLCKFSAVPILLRGILGTAYLWCHSKHASYGRIFRSSPKEISITDAEAVRQVIWMDDLPKAPFYAAIRVEPAAPTLLTSVRREDRKRLSDLTVHTLAGRNSAMLESTFKAMMTDYCDLLDDQCQLAQGGLARINIYGQLTNLAMDIIGQVVWGKTFGFLGKNESIKTLSAMDLSNTPPYRSLKPEGRPVSAVEDPEWQQVPAAIYEHTPYLGLGTFLRQWTVRPNPNKSAIKVLRVASSQMHEAAKESQDYAGILFTSTMRGAAKGTFSSREATNHGAELVVGGTDSITGVVTAALIYLMENPTTLKKLTSTISAVESGQLPDYSDLRDNEYLTCVLKEAMRLHTPVNFSIRQVPRHMTDYKLMGYDIPAKTMIRVPLRAIHRDPEYWPQPDRFWPERWLSDANARDGAPAANERAFFGFSLGSRICVGKTYAWLLMRYMLGGVLARYEVGYVERQTTEWESVFVSSLKGGVYMTDIKSRAISLQ